MKKFLSLLLTLVLCLSQTAPGVSYAATRTLNNAKLELHVGETCKLSLTGISGNIKWKSSNKSVATVSSTGALAAVSVGKSTITATNKSKKYKCTVTVISNKTVEVIYRMPSIDIRSIEEFAQDFYDTTADCLDAKVYDKEHIVATMYESDFIKDKKEFTKNYEDYISSMVSNSNGMFTDADVDELFQNIKIYADKDKFKSLGVVIAYGKLSHLSDLSDIIQGFNLINPDDRIYNISIIDNSTGEVLSQYHPGQ